MNERRVEYMPLESVPGATRNPKRHSGDIPVSMRRFGFTEPLLIDERTGKLVAGHGRLEAVRQLKAGKEEPPPGVRVKKGQWEVPVVRGWSSRSDTEADAYLLASNRLTEKGGWEDAGLAELLLELEGAHALEGTGFGPEDLAALLKSLEAPKDGLTEPDDVPEVDEKDVYVKPGELWLLGEHRILCGDSTKAEDVARVMGGERAGLMNTDPPYGVTYANDERPNPGVAKPRVAKPRVANDELTDDQLQAFLESAFRTAVNLALTKDAAWYLWHAHLTQGYFAAAAAVANVVLHRQIIWVKPVLLLGRGQYHWKHEPCFMGWVRGNQPPDYGLGEGERTQTTVWEIAHVTQKERKEFDHSTPKPVGLFEVPITKHLNAGEVAYEPFSGSGPQIIACERLGRRCRAIELSPKFVQVAIERWEAFTGKKATLASE